MNFDDKTVVPDRPQRMTSLRMVGAVGLACACILTYFSAIAPIQAAAKHESIVMLSLKGAVFAPLALFAGLAYTVAPFWALRFLGAPFESNPKKWWFYAPLLILGWLVYLAVTHKIASYGYAARSTG